jgi:hypothetical protein
VEAHRARSHYSAAYFPWGLECGAWSISQWSSLWRHALRVLGLHGLFERDSATDANPVVVTTSSAHGLSTDDVVSIEECPNGGANGTWQIRVLPGPDGQLTSSSSFALLDSSGDGHGPRNGGLIRKTVVTTGTAHGLMPGGVAQIAGIVGESPGVRESGADSPRP